MLDVLAATDVAMYQHFLNWIAIHPDKKPPMWATDFIEETNSRIDESIKVFLVPCTELFVSGADWNATRMCQPDWVPCMQLATRAVFYPLPEDGVDKVAWKLGLLHEFAHLYPPNPTHNFAFKEQYYAFCSMFGLPHKFMHVRGHLI